MIDLMDIIKATRKRGFSAGSCNMEPASSFRAHPLASPARPGKGYEGNSTFSSRWAPGADS
ncbi:hypothetical protein ES705_36548 [subsurface metagenome]